MELSLTELVGIVAGFLTTGSFIPQVVKILRTRDVSGISLLMYVAFTSGVLLWLIYGIINSQMAIIAANGITLALASVILAMKICYRDGKETSKTKKVAECEPCNLSVICLAIEPVSVVQRHHPA